LRESTESLGIISFTGGERKNPFPNRLSGEEECFANVAGNQIWIEREDVLSRLALSNESHDCRDWDPEPAEARDSPHLGGISRDSLELHEAPL
jgi:hypothetical protein